MTALHPATPGAERSGFDRTRWIGHIAYPDGHRIRLRGASFDTEPEAVAWAASRIENITRRQQADAR